MKSLFRHLEKLTNTIGLCYVLPIIGLCYVLPFVTGVAESHVVPDVTCVVYNLHGIWRPYFNSCDFNYTMTCSWPIAGTTVNYSIKYSVWSDIISDCPNPSINSCSWRSSVNGRNSFIFDEYIEYQMWIIDNDGHSRHFSVKPYDVVVPSVTAVVVLNVTSNLALLHLKNPSYCQDNLLCCISYQRLECNHAKQSFNGSVGNVSLSNLESNSKYNIAVQCIHISNGSNGVLIPYGIWSNPVVISLQTAQGVPSKLAEIAAGGFTREPMNERELDVTVFWQPIPMCMAGGVVTGYTVFYRIRHDKLVVPLSDWSMKSVSSDSSNVRLILKSDLNYEIIVHASTALGLNEFLQPEPIIVTHEIKDFIAGNLSFKVQSNASDVILEWDSVTNATGYTVYWCQTANGEPSDCQNAAEWTHVPSHQNVFSHHFDDLRQLGFAISVEFFSLSLNYTTSSGMIWSRCIHRTNADIVPPIDLKLQNDVRETSIHVQWSEPPCNATGYISHYLIEYCRLLDRQCVDIKHLSVKAPSTGVSIPSLMPSTTYQVRVMSCSRLVNSAFSEILTGTTSGEITSQTWLIFTISLILVILICVCAAMYIYWKKRVNIKVPEPSDRLDKLINGVPGDDYI